MQKSKDIDRSLAIFYHPLYQETIHCWCKVFGCQQYQNLQITFLEFIEFNLKIQKCLLVVFDMQNAFLSALNDWVKEVTECFKYKELFTVNQDNLKNLLQEIKTSSLELSLNPDQYIQFIDQYKEHKAFQFINYKLTAEVFSKFIFDLCSTWCEFMDIELFIYFMLSIFMSITEGQSMYTSKFQNISKIQNLPYDFFKELEQLIHTYTHKKKRQLRYYRAWCEWNYLRINQIGENILLKLNEFYPTEEKRIMELIDMFEKSIDLINGEINTQNTKNNNTIPHCTISETEGIKNQQISYNSSIDIPLNILNNENQIQESQKVEKHVDQYQIVYDVHSQQYVLQKSVKLGIKGKKVAIYPYPELEQQKLQRIFMEQEKNVQYSIDQNYQNVQKVQYKEPKEAEESAIGYYKKQFDAQEIVQNEYLEHQNSKQSSEIMVDILNMKMEKISLNKYFMMDLMNQKGINDIKGLNNRIMYTRQNSKNGSRILDDIFVNNKFSDRIELKPQNLFANSVRQQKSFTSYDNSKNYGRINTQKPDFIIKKNVDQNVKKRQNTSTINPYSHEMIMDNDMIKIREQCIRQKFYSKSQQIPPQQSKIYQLLQIDKGDEFCENWDTLYKIINEKRQIFKNDPKFGFFNVLNLDFQKNEKRTLEMDGELTQEDKERFRLRIERLLKRDQRKKLRRKNRPINKLQPIKTNNYILKKKRNVVTKRFINSENREQYRDVFIDPIKNKK